MQPPGRFAFAKPPDGESIVIDRSIESLLRRADRDAFNRFILAQDALARYDSSVISVKNLAAVLGVGAAVIYASEN